MQPGRRVEPERRCSFRWEGPESEAVIGPRYEAFVRNISEGGALVEHAHRVRPGTVLLLTLSVLEQTITLSCQVVRSAEYRYEVLPNGEREHVYRTGLEFLRIPEASRVVLAKYMASQTG